MTLVLQLPPELERRLAAEAERQGVSLSDYALQLLTDNLQPHDRSKQLVAMLQSWQDEEDPTEQQTTADFLIKALDEDRLSDRKLFPPELKGKSW
jgi:hypothetical protein